MHLIEDMRRGKFLNDYRLTLDNTIIMSSSQYHAIIATGTALGKLIQS